MFTGIITHLGTVVEKEKTSLRIKADRVITRKLHKGDSLAIDGTCLTVAKVVNSTTLAFELTPETWRRTIFFTLQKEDLVNLELPLGVADRFGGHFIQGHIDGVGVIQSIKKDGNSRVITITVPKRLSIYIVEKGFIAVNGISLTVVEAKPAYFTICIIPYTLKNTMLGQASVGDLVNIEVDILAKYLEKLLKKKKS